MRKIIILVTILLFTLTGCKSESLIPFETNPDTIISKSIEADFLNLDELREMHKHYRVNNTLFTETEKFTAFYEGLSESEQRIFEKRANMVMVLYFNYEGNESEFDKHFIGEIKNYLLATKQGSSDVTPQLSKELLEKDLKNVVKTYMENLDIKIDELLLPDALVSIDRWNYPIKADYKYIVKGTMEGVPFEREITQSFYFGANLDEVDDIAKATLLIEGIE